MVVSFINKYQVLPRIFYPVSMLKGWSLPLTLYSHLRPRVKIKSRGQAMLWGLVKGSSTLFSVKVSSSIVVNLMHCMYKHAVL